MFRRKKDTGETEPAGPGEAAGEAENTPPLKPFSRRGAHVPKHPPATAFRADLPRRTVEIPGGRRSDRGTGEATEGKKLIVGREISLQGEITACEKLVVEGRVEATLTHGRSIEIAESGFFKGEVVIDEADVSGRFEGELTARTRLTVRAGGRICGKIRYGTLEIEAGGQISGDVDMISETAGSSAYAILSAPSKPTGSE
ncbi:MAG: polymer-forming cytoskeletal protein [Proteobacteria bacterium]|nr:polymer-forming cytoskeletal protein [Pseudomonadota bacterium]